MLKSYDTHSIISGASPLKMISGNTMFILRLKGDEVCDSCIIECCR